MPPAARQLERAERVAGIVGAHTQDVCLLAVAHVLGQLDEALWWQQTQARCMRTCLALLAVLHEQGPP